MHTDSLSVSPNKKMIAMLHRKKEKKNKKGKRRRKQ